MTAPSFATSRRFSLALLAALACVGTAYAADTTPAKSPKRTPVTGSHIDASRGTLLESAPVIGATTDASAHYLSASERKAPQRPAIAEIDATEWLPADQAAHTPR